MLEAICFQSREVCVCVCVCTSTFVSAQMCALLYKSLANPFLAHVTLSVHANKPACNNTFTQGWDTMQHTCHSCSHI